MIKPITECPYCGYDEYYVITYISGKSATWYKYNGEHGDNSEMHETLKYKENKTMFCANCFKKVGVKK